MAEGAIWEALDKASYYRLSNLIAIAVTDGGFLSRRGGGADMPVPGFCENRHEWAAG
jgi:hypothetical protein